MEGVFLFLANSLTQFNELSRLAISLKEREYRVLFIIRSSNKIIEKKCIELKLEYIDYDKIVFNKQKKIFFLKRIWLKILYKLPLVFSIFLSKKNIHYFQYIYHIDKDNAKYLIHTYSPLALFVSEDGVGSPLILLKFFQKKSIPIIDYPYEYSTSKQLENRSLGDKNYKIKNIREKCLLTFFAKKWVKKIQNKEYTVVPTQEAILYTLFGVKIPNPWTVHGGISDFLISESLFMKQHYINEGIESKKIMLLGSISDDLLFENLNDKNFKITALSDLKLDINKKTILCALIPDYTQTMRCEFDNYKDLVDFWINNLNTIKEFNVIFQLHPAIAEEHKNYIVSKNINLSEKSIVDLIPICDIYITSVSSTIRYAIACSKPVINYDMYFMNYPDYQECQGVITIQEKEDFLNNLNLITNSQEFYEDLKLIQKEQSKIWGMMDGKSSDRIINFLETKILNRNKA